MVQAKSNREHHELNLRFQQVYKMLQARGIIVSHDRQKSKAKFAKSLQVKSNQIDRWLNGSYLISFEAATLLCQVYGINRAYLLDGLGSPFGGVPKNLRSDVREVDNMPTAKVAFAGLAAFAGNTIGEDSAAEDTREVFMIPGISGEMVAFSVSGNSMDTTLRMGDMIFCTQVFDKSDLIDGEVYVISFKNEKAINVKRIERIFDRRGNWTHLRLISDNKDYEPFDVELSDIGQAFRVTRRLTGL